MSEDEVRVKFGKLLKVRNFTQGTERSYWSMYERFSVWCHSNSIILAEISYEQLHDYVLYLKDDIHYAPKTQNSNISFLRFLFTYVLNRPLDRYMLPYARINLSIPEILTQAEIIKFINALPNLKSKAIVMLLYSCGLRASEVVALKYSDISRERMTVYIAQAKNRSARYVPLSETAMNLLTQYWLNTGKPKGWLFPSTKQDVHISKATVFAYITQAKEKLGWEDRRITSHTFRHCLGTHMYEAGYDLPYIQKFLGHKAISSTMVYITLTGRKDYPSLMDNMVKGGLKVE